MRKILAILIVLALAAMTLPTAQPTQAQDGDRFPLAAFFPEDTGLYFQIRVDDAYLTELDAVLTKVANQASDVGLPRELLRMGLVSALARAGLNYEKDIRTWLGNTIAIGISDPTTLLDFEPDNNLDALTLIAAQITDQAAADGFVQRLINSDPTLKKAMTRTTRAEGIAYTFADSSLPFQMLITKEALFIGTNPAVSAVSNPTAPKLSASAELAGLAGKLPEQAYNFYGYIGSKFHQSFLTANAEMLGAAPLLMEAFGNAYKGQLLAGTIVDGRILALDVAGETDMAVLAQAGLAMPSYKPIDPAFAAKLPSNVAGMIHFSDLKGFIDYLISNYFINTALYGFASTGPSQREAEEMIFNQLKATTSIDWQKDFLSWMTSDVMLTFTYDGQDLALVNMILESAVSTSSTFATPDLSDFGFGIIAKTSDPEKTKTFIAKLDSLMDRWVPTLPPDANATFGTQTIEGVEAKVLSLNLPSTKMPLQIAYGLQGDVFVFGTLTVASDVFAGRTTDLTAASAFSLTNASVNAYLLPKFSTMLTDIIAAMQIAQPIIASKIMIRMSGPPTPTPSADPLGDAKKAYAAARERLVGLEKLLQAAVLSVSADSNSAIGRALIILAQ
jgi:Protein of unknown function (DUF3352)